MPADLDGIELLLELLRGDPRRWYGWATAPHNLELEAMLLPVVAGFRRQGAGGDVDFERVALLADRWLRRLAEARRQQAQACTALGLVWPPRLEGGEPVRTGDLRKRVLLAAAREDAHQLRSQGSDSRFRPWWWPEEVPAQPLGWSGGAPVARPIVYLADYDGERDVLGLGERWRPGDVGVVPVIAVLEAWRRAGVRDCAGRPLVARTGAPVAAVGDVDVPAPPIVEAEVRSPTDDEIAAFLRGAPRWRPLDPRDEWGMPL